jgi:hypothetical protein
MLIGTDILKFYKMVIDFESVLFRVDSCNFETLIKTEYKGICVYRKVKAFQRTVIPAYSVTKIPIKCSLSKGKDFLFKPTLQGAYAHIVDELSFVQVRNNSPKTRVIGRSIALSTVNEYEKKGCYLAIPFMEYLACRNIKRFDLKITALLAVTAMTGFGIGISNPSTTDFYIGMKKSPSIELP